MKISPFASIRVELSSALDLWMRGARFGTIRSVDTKTGIATVALDRVRKLQKIRIMDLSARMIRNQKWPGAFILEGTRVYFCDVLDGRIQIKDTPGYAFDFCGWIDPDQLERES